MSSTIEFVKSSLDLYETRQQLLQMEDGSERDKLAKTYSRQRDRPYDTVASLAASRWSDDPGSDYQLLQHCEGFFNNIAHRSHVMKNKKVMKFSKKFAAIKEVLEAGDLVQEESLVALAENKNFRMIATEEDGLLARLDNVVKTEKLKPLYKDMSREDKITTMLHVIQGLQAKGPLRVKFALKLASIDSVARDAVANEDSMRETGARELKNQLDNSGVPLQEKLARENRNKDADDHDTRPQPDDYDSRPHLDL